MIDAIPASKLDLSTPIGRDRLYALAISAFGWRRDEQDIQSPEDPAIDAVDLEDEMRAYIESGRAFGIGYRLGLAVGASVALDPLATPNLESTLQELRTELEGAVSDGKRSSGVILQRKM